MAADDAFKPAIKANEEWRNRLSVELAAHLGAELPLLVRSACCDQHCSERQQPRPRRGHRRAGAALT
ncbi:hypothetical protein [Chelatococcus sambhunathii]|uniref:hypothetical protein n=1 Tax=Chelatococcus sambhunathii TaxID=363953 RepID=UPI0006E28D23|nr:hypothetical protein [Chelatococcus sambhunathii]